MKIKQAKWITLRICRSLIWLYDYNLYFRIKL